MNVQNNDNDTDDSDLKQWYQMTTVWEQNWKILTFNIISSFLFLSSDQTSLCPFGSFVHFPVTSF